MLRCVPTTAEQVIQEGPHRLSPPPFGGRTSCLAPRGHGTVGVDSPNRRWREGARGKVPPRAASPSSSPLCWCPPSPPWVGTRISTLAAQRGRASTPAQQSLCFPRLFIPISAFSLSRLSGLWFALLFPCCQAHRATDVSGEDVGVVQ